MRLNHKISNKYLLEQLGNLLIYEERNYDVKTLIFFSTSIANFVYTALFFFPIIMAYCRFIVDEQQNIYEKILINVNQNGSVSFLHG